MRSHELKDIQLFEEDGQYYLKLKYIIEHDHCVEELEIPKARIPFNERSIPTFKRNPGTCYRSAECFLMLDDSYDSLRLMQGETAYGDAFYTSRVIEEKPVELTVSEIEKKLGYKIKIVNKD